MIRIIAVLLVASAFTLATVHSQYLGIPYATTATSFSLPFIGGFQYAPVLKTALPYAAPGFPYGAPFAHGVAPVVKAAFPYGQIVKTAVPAVAPVVKAAYPFAAPIGPYGPIVKAALPAPVVKSALPFPAPFAAPVPVGPAPAVPVPAPVAF